MAVTKHAAQNTIHAYDVIHGQLVFGKETKYNRRDGRYLFLDDRF
jgi:hypothetical protein